MKKLLALFLAMLLIFSMTACSTTDPAASSSADASESAAETTDDTAEPTTSEAATSEADNAGSSGNLVIGFSQVGHESDWRNANTNSMKEAFSEKNGYTLIFDDADNDQAKQITAVRNFIQQEVDYIVIAPVVETGWDTVLQEAKDSGIPVIIVDRLVDVSDDSLYTAWVGSNFLQEGYDAAGWLAEEVSDDEEINIVVLQGTIGSSAQIGRTDGFSEKAEAHGNWNILEMQTGNFEQAQGQEVMESFLKKYDDIDVVVCENDNMAFGAIDAIEAAGLTCGPEGDITIISFDAVNAAF